MLDFDAAGNAIGVEVLDVRERMTDRTAVKPAQTAAE